MIRLPAFHARLSTDNGLIIECSNGQELMTIEYRDMLRFLVGQPDNVPKSVPRVVWNLTAFVDVIKQFLPAPMLKDLDGEDHRATWQEGEIRYRLFYQPGKFFGVHAGGYGEEITIYELDQFFPNDAEVKSVADVKKLADELVMAFQKLGVGTINNLKSPVAVMEDCGVMEKIYKGLPDPSAIPSGCLEYATLSDAWGAWCSAYQVGYWEKAYSYDMASCYPSIAGKLLSLEGARYEFSKNMLEGATYAFLRGKLYINPQHPFAYCSPIVAPIDNDMGNPVGTIPGMFTLGQVKYIERNGMGHFDLSKRDGGWFIFTQSDKRPLAEAMAYYYSRRDDGEVINMLGKRIMAGIIGRLGQYIKDEPTKYTNPVYHSLIRNAASLLVGQFLVNNEFQETELLHVNTDGFHALKDLSVPAKAPMGKWRCDAESLIVLSPDKIYEGEKCQPVLDAIKQDKGEAIISDDIDLMTLSAEQNRYFPNYPLSGRELLKAHYASEAVELK